MQILDDTVTWMRETMAAAKSLWRVPPFNCTDCERWERCGMEPQSACRLYVPRYRDMDEKRFVDRTRSYWP
jgi:hypothetical protein